MKKLFLILLSLIVANAFAQPNIVISPESIVVNPRPAFNVEVFVDKDPSGNATPSYAIGEEIRIGVRVDRDAYIYLFNVRSNGVIDQILPNRFDAQGENNFLRSGETKFFPPQNARYSFNVDGPTGLDKVIAVASRDPLNTEQLARFSASGDFATSSIGEEGFAEALSIIVRPIPQETWVTDTALFWVGSPPSTPRYGTLNITSSPSGAQAFVDGQFVGFTPVRFGTLSGNRSVRVELDGYETFSTTVNVRGGRTEPVNANLRQARRTGTVTFTSQPSGAEVYVDGRLVGTTPTGAITLDEGSYEARFARQGYNDSFVTFQVSRNSSQTVSRTLQARQGALAITANVGGALVFVNGSQVGTIASGSGQLTVSNLPAGTHELVVVAPGYRTYLSDFTVRSGQTTDVRVQQSRR